MIEVSIKFFLCKVINNKKVERDDRKRLIISTNILRNDDDDDYEHKHFHSFPFIHLLINSFKQPSFFT